ncbi:hypothetical protein [Pseudolactococcus insecticola]|uniref:Uncharacterized protein n=1 Tax=Pseudolactococcus insecticola TaxID=2709158 RepID=A0A6A0B7T5_9LACT|nr:hypothetical protein [Lactococcus insecticola]GFH41400.1 hypothetical protein Hs20B_17980 [Lactococcus insecticola]
MKTYNYDEISEDWFYLTTPYGSDDSKDNWYTVKELVALDINKFPDAGVTPSRDNKKDYENDRVLLTEFLKHINF